LKYNFGTMDNRDVKREIFECGRDMFYRNGYNKVKLDEIAKSLAISKKTFYNYYPNKLELLKDIVSRIKEDLFHDIEAILNDNTLSFSEKLKRNLSAITFRISDISTKFAEDLQHYAPEIYQDWLSYKAEASMHHLTELIQEGKRAGFVRQDVNIQTTVLIFICTLDSMLDPVFLNKLPSEFTRPLPPSPVEKFNAIMKVVYEGILTDEVKKTYHKIQ